MKKGKRLIVLTVVLAVFVAGTVILQRVNANNEAAKNTTAPVTVVSETDKASLSEIAYTYEGDSLRFTKDGENWKYADDPNFPLNQSKVTAMADALKKITATRTAADTMVNAGDFGLAEPSLIVTATLADGTKKTLRFGDKNSVTGDTYVNVDGSPTVYTVASSVPGNFRYKLYSLITDEAFPTLDTSTVDKLGITTPEGTANFSQHSGGSNDVYSTSFTWLINNADGTASPADATKLSDYLTTLTGITYTGTADYDATPEELAAYGLDNPAATIDVDYTIARQEAAPAVSATPAASAIPAASIAPALDTAQSSIAPLLPLPSTAPAEQPSTAPTEQASATPVVLATPSPTPAPITVVEAKRLTITLGKKADNGDYYMRHSDSNRVFTINSTTYDALKNLTAKDARAMQVDLVPFDTVDALHVTMDGQTKDFTITRAKATDADGKTSTTTTYKLGDKEIDATAFKAFYTKLIGLKAEKVIPEAAQGAAPETSLVSAQETVPVRAQTTPQADAQASAALGNALASAQITPQVTPAATPTTTPQAGPEATVQPKPYLTVVFDRNTSNFKQMELRVLPYDSSFYEAQFNGETGLLVNKRDVEALVEAFKGLGE